MVWHGAESYVDCHFLSTSNNVLVLQLLNRSLCLGIDLCYDEIYPNFRVHVLLDELLLKQCIGCTLIIKFWFF
jgi:hypothetical protein